MENGKSFTKRIIDFIKYNNFTVLIALFIFIAGAGVFASETGQEVLGKKETKTEGIDNTVLLSADLSSFDMSFKIEKIEEDENMYYVIYSFIDLVKIDGAWQYQLASKTRKVSKKLKEDLGIYLAKELGEEYAARLKYLKKEQDKARTVGEQTRTAVTEYSGLIGQALRASEKIFPGYQAARKKALPSPDLNWENLKNYRPQNEASAGESGSAENLEEVYNEYLANHLEEIQDLNSDTSPTAPAEETDSSSSVSSESSESENVSAEESLTNGNSEGEEPSNEVNEESAGETGEVEVVDLPAEEEVSGENSAGEGAAGESGTQTAETAE